MLFRSVCMLTIQKCMKFICSVLAESEIISYQFSHIHFLGLALVLIRIFMLMIPSFGLVLGLKMSLLLEAGFSELLRSLVNS